MSVREIQHRDSEREIAIEIAEQKARGMWKEKEQTRKEIAKRGRQKETGRQTDRQTDVPDRVDETKNPDDDDDSDALLHRQVCLAPGLKNRSRNTNEGKWASRGSNKDETSTKSQIQKVNFISLKVFMKKCNNNLKSRLIILK